jgi:cation transporter-like permease
MIRLHSGNHDNASPLKQWSLELRGSIVAADAGSWLRGRIGPPAFVLLLAAVFLGCGSAFFLGGLAALLTHLASGRPALSLLPFVLIPAGMLAWFVLVMVVGARAAKRDWSLVDRWLRSLLDAP